MLIDDTETTVLLTEGLTSAFSELHPNVSFDVEQRPGGADGDNIVKTRLATGEMADVFFYNSGSLLQALDPAETIVDLAGDPMLDNVVDAFIPTVSQGDGVYGVPFGTGLGGGILYRKDIFEENGLSVPLTWEEFAANNEALLEAGVTPVGASFGTTWTSQLFVLADYYNVAQEVPDFAEQYTANEAHYADTPAALRSFERLQEAYDSGWWNEDYGSATYEDALQMLIDGEIAQYPMLTFAMSEVAALDPEAAQNIGFFAQPGEDAETNGMTLWMPAAPTSRRRNGKRSPGRSSPSSPRWRGPRRRRRVPHRRGRTSSRAPRCPTTCCRRCSTSRRTSTPATSARRSSSSRRSRVRTSSTSPSRSDRACAAPKTPPPSTTKTSRSRPSNSASRAGDGDSPHHRPEPGGTWVDDGPGPTADRLDHAADDRQPIAYPHWFYLPAGLVFAAMFVVPTAMAFFYSLTRWTLFDWEFIGLDNFRQFFREPALTNGLRNTVIYAVVTSGLKVVLGMALAMLVTSRIRLKGTIRSIVFFPVLVSFVAVGITFKVMMHPTKGLINRTIDVIGVRAEVADRPADRPAVGRPRRRLEGRRAGDGDLHRRHRVDPVGAAGVGVRRRRQCLGPVPLRHPPAEQAGDVHGDPAVVHRRAAVVRPDLDDDRWGTRLHHRRARLDDLQALPGRLLRPLDRRQRDPVHPRHAIVFPLNWFLRKRELTS